MADNTLVIITGYGSVSPKPWKKGYLNVSIEKANQRFLEEHPNARDVTSHLTQWIGQIKHQPRKSTMDFLTGLNQQVYLAITYSQRLQSGVQTAEETLRRAIGSCRDSAWLLVQLLRKLGLAARFVSGYLVQLESATTGLNAASAGQADSLSLHAWAEVYVPGAGWIGLDPTSGSLTTEGHIPLACTPHAKDAAPVTGTSSLSEAKLTYNSTLVRLA